MSYSEKKIVLLGVLFFGYFFVIVVTLSFLLGYSFNYSFVLAFVLLNAITFFSLLLIVGFVNENHARNEVLVMLLFFVSS